MRAATTLLLSVLTAMTAWANDAVTYIDMDGNQQTEDHGVGSSDHFLRLLFGAHRGTVPL